MLRRKMQQLARLKERVELWRELGASTSSLLELTDLALEEEDDSFEEHLRAEAQEISLILDREEFPPDPVWPI